MLLPADPTNYYRAHDLVPLDLFESLHQAKILITNFHVFLPRERVAMPKLSRSVLVPQWGGVQKKKAGRILDGRAWDQVPSLLPVVAERLLRQFWM